MLQFDAASYHAKDNVAHRVRRYVRLFGASGLVPDEENRRRQVSCDATDETSLALGIKRRAL